MAENDLFGDPNLARKAKPAQPVNPDAINNGADLAGAGGNVGGGAATTNAGGDLANYGQGGDLAAAAAGKPQTAAHDAVPPAPAAIPAADATSRPPSQTTPQPAETVGTPPDPFAASGGGTYFASTGQWVPNNNPAAIAAAQAANGGVAGTGGGAAPGAPAAPAAPTAPPANAPGATGPLPLVNGADPNMYLKALSSTMTENKVPDVNDPEIRAQLDPIRVEAQRALDAENRQGAEQGFAQGTGYGAPERMAAAARSGERVGLAASDLVGREMSARRDEIRNTLQQYGAYLTDQQKQQLTREQMEIDRQLQTRSQDIQREGIAQQGALGFADIGARRDIAKMGGANDLIRTLLNNQQAGNSLAAQLGLGEADLNQRAMSLLLGG